MSRRTVRDATRAALAVPGITTADVARTRGDHYVLDATHQDGRTARVYLSSTPSDHRALRNLQRDVKRALRPPEE